MYTKTLLFILSIAAFSSCSTAYKSGQTPDDVYYSPVRVEEDNNDRDDDRDQVSSQPEDRQIRMTIYDRRWRYFDDYSYNNSPYNYCYCQCNHYTGYYYNPYYYPAPIYNVKLNTIKQNSTPRMVNLNAYHNYNPAFANNPKGSTRTNWATPSTRYNNSNTRQDKGLGNAIRRVIAPKEKSSSTSTSSNDSRSYTPSSNSSSSSNSNSNSSSSSSSGTNTRPARGN